MLDSDLSKSDSKLRLGIEPERTVVLCGSVSSPNEQYHNWLLNLKGIDQETNAHLLFTFTYSVNGSDTEELIEIIKQNFNHFTIIQGFQSEEEMVTIRKAIDIFINMRVSDQLAGSMLEAFCSDTDVICANWLQYDIIEENGFYFSKVHKFDDLKEEVIRKIQHKNELKFRAELAENKEKMSRIFSRKVLIERWHQLFDFIKEAKA